MKKFVYGVVGIVALLLVLSFAKNGLGGQLAKNKEELGLAGKVATIYKSITCGCCRVFADYLERYGIKVQRKDLPELSSVKSEYGIPQSLQSCHTTVIDDYVVEGHIPAEAIAKLLKERPQIKGIAMPGMPSGSPGMPGPKEPFVIYELDGKDNSKVFLEM